MEGMCDRLASSFLVKRGRMSVVFCSVILLWSITPQTGHATDSVTSHQPHQEFLSSNHHHHHHHDDGHVGSTVPFASHHHFDHSTVPFASHHHHHHFDHSTVPFVSRFGTLEPPLIHNETSLDAAAVPSSEQALLKNEVGCDFNKDWSSAAKCDWAERCSDGSSHIPYKKLSFCSSKPKTLVSVFLLVWTVFLFTLSGVASDRYLTPPVVHLATLLSLSDALAGCTLIAVANSAGDIMSGVIAAYHDGNQLGIFMGDMLGGSLFLMSLAFGAVIWCSPSPIYHLKRSVTLRDSGVLVVSIIGVGCFPYVPEWAWWAPLLFLLLAAAYVITAIKLDKRVELPTLVLPKNEDERAPLCPKETTLAAAPPPMDARRSSSWSTCPLTPPDSGLTGRRWSSNLALETRAGRRLLSRIVSEPPDVRERHLSMLSTHPAQSLCVLTGKVESEAKPFAWSANIIFSAVTEVLIYPVVTLFDLTIPTIELVTEPIWHTALFFVTCPAVICIHSWKAINPIISTCVMAVGVGAAIIYFVSFSFRSSKGIYKNEASLIRTSISVFMAIFWSAVITAEIIECVSALGLVQGLSIELLGLTVVAWGNNVGDLFANVALSKAGHIEMGLVGTYGSSILSICFGVPIVCAVHTVRQLVGRTPLTAAPFSLTLPMAVTAAAAVAVVLLWLIYAMISNFRVARTSGLYLVAGFVSSNFAIILVYLMDL